MTVNTITSRATYNGDGVTLSPFAVPFYFLQASDLAVYVAGVKLTLTTDYSVTGAGIPAGGFVSFMVAPPAGTGNVVIIRDPDQLQSTKYPPNDPFPAVTHETALDKLTMLVQRLRDLVSRSFTLSDSDTSGASLTIPSPVDGYLLGWLGNKLVNFANTGAGGGGLPLPVSTPNGGTGSSFATFAALVAAIKVALGYGTAANANTGSTVGNVALIGAADLVSGVCDFRLTLTSGVPVTNADVVGATTLYCTPYRGKKIALYDGTTRWNTRASAEFSIALGTLTSGLPYDVFCFDNAGVPALEILAWSSATARATALVMQDGVPSKTGALTRRYMGTFFTTATTTTEDSAANRYLWNNYNRVARTMVRKEVTASWTYTTATYRQANAATANQLNFVRGLDEDAVQANSASTVRPSTSCNTQIAIGLDSTTVPTGLWTDLTVGPSSGTLNASYSGLPGLGKHSLMWLEISEATGTTVWYGNGTPASGGPSAIQSGIQGSVQA